MKCTYKVTCPNILREQDTFLVSRDPSEPDHGSLLALEQMGMDTSTDVHPCHGLTGRIPVWPGQRMSCSSPFLVP